MASNFKQWLLSIGFPFILTACDGSIEFAINEDNTSSIIEKAFITADVCERFSTNKMLRKPCNPDLEDTTYDATSDTFTYIVENSTKPITPEEMAQLNLELFEDTGTFTMNAPITVLRNLSGRASRDEAPIATKFPFPPYLFDGKTVTITITAMEITETNGKISHDGKQVKFQIPSAYLAYGLSEDAISFSTLFVKGRYK